MLMPLLIGTSAKVRSAQQKILLMQSIKRWAS